MSPKTMFRAYTRIISDQRRIETTRGIDGIAVDVDDYAMLWQRRERQQQRIEARFNEQQIHCSLCASTTDGYHHMFCAHHILYNNEEV